MNNDERNQAIDLIVARALELRRAGVRDIDLDGVAVTFADYEEEVPPSEHDELLDDDSGDPLDDPRTYGLRGKVPGFARLGNGEDDRQ